MVSELIVYKFIGRFHLYFMKIFVPKYQEENYVISKKIVI